MRLKGEGEASPPPTDSAVGERKTSASPEPRLDEHLRAERTAAEAELRRLGRDPQAWQHIRPYFTGTSPSFGFGPMAETLLGPRTTTAGRRGVIPTRELRAFRAIEKKAKRCRRCQAALVGVSRNLADQVMIDQARKHHEELFRQYCTELKRPIPSVILEAPARAAAQRAATADAARRQIGSPLACYAAGAYLEQQRLLAWAVRTLMPQVGKQARRRFLEGVADGNYPEVEKAAVHRALAKAARVSVSNFSVTCGDLRRAQAASLRKEVGKCSSRSRTAVLITA